MKQLVIFDSVFGNTHEIAQAIAKGMGAPAPVAVSEVQLAWLEDTSVLVVGSPTRGFRPTPALTQWLQSLDSQALAGTEVAAFDTRIALGTIRSRLMRWMVNTGGYAAARITRGLLRKGGQLLLPAEGFFVEGTEGPLQPGELDRARHWGQQLRGQAQERSLAHSS